jgi:hypothetical protein
VNVGSLAWVAFNVRVLQVGFLQLMLCCRATAAGPARPLAGSTVCKQTAACCTVHSRALFQGNGCCILCTGSCCRLLRMQEQLLVVDALQYLGHWRPCLLQILHYGLQLLGSCRHGCVDVVR